MTPGASKAAASTSRVTGSLFSCSAVSTVRVSTDETSMVGMAVALTDTPSRLAASTALLGSANDTSEPLEMVTPTLSRVLTTAPLFSNDTLYVPGGNDAKR